MLNVAQNGHYSVTFVIVCVSSPMRCRAWLIFIILDLFRGETDYTAAEIVYSADTYFTEDNIPEWLCPACMAPSLELLPGSFHSQHSAYSLHNRREDWYDYDHEEFVFTCILQCRRSSCRESVAVSGSGRGEREPDERQEDMVYYTLYRAKSFTPPLPVFSLPEDCPEDVKCQLKMAASLLPISGSAALNSMRIALELLLDNMEIPRFSMDSGKPWPIKLGTRIERFKDKLGPHQPLRRHYQAVTYRGRLLADGRSD